MRPRPPGQAARPADHARAVLDAIRAIIRTVRDFSTLTESSVGLSGAQIFALATISKHGPLSVNELAARTLTHQSSVSVVASKLVDRGLCDKHPSVEDARRVELAVTPAGRALLERAPEPIQDRLIDAIHEMPETQQQELALLLGDLAERVAAEGAAAPMFFESAPDAPAAAPRSRTRARRGVPARRGAR